MQLIWKVDKADDEAAMKIAILHGSPVMAGVAIAQWLTASGRVHDSAALRAIPIPAHLASDEARSKKFVDSFERQLNSHHGKTESWKDRHEREAKNHGSALVLEKTIEKARGLRRSHG